MAHDLMPTRLCLEQLLQLTFHCHIFHRIGLTVGTLIANALLSLLGKILYRCEWKECPIVEAVLFVEATISCKT